MRNLGHYSVYYCCNCHEPTDFDALEANDYVTISERQYYNTTFFSNDKYYEYKRDIEVQCPKCGYVSKKDEVILVYGANNPIIYEDAYYKDFGDKLHLYLFFKEVTFFNKKVQQHHLVALFIFNFATGQSYQMETRYKGTNKRWRCYQGNRIRNISLSVHYPGHPYEIKDKKLMQDLCLIFQRKISERLGYNVKSLIDYAEDMNLRYYEAERFNTPQIFAEYLRMPNMNTFMLDYFIDSYFSPSDTRNKLMNAVKTAKHNSPDPIKDILTKLKAPITKSIRKVVNENYDSIFYLDLFDQIKDVNNLRRLIAWVDSRRYSYQFYMADEVKNLIKLFLNKMNETVLTNKILQSEPMHFFDAARSLNQIIRKNPDYDFDHKRSFADLHDLFSLDLRKMQQENRTISYAEKDYKLEQVIDGYEFKLAKDTHELIEVGSKMNICVGSYGNSAYDKQLAIVVAYKDNQPTICFELDANLKSVHQAKLKFNKRPEGQDYEVAMKWIKEHGLEIATIDLEQKENNDEFRAIVPAELIPVAL